MTARWLTPPVSGFPISQRYGEHPEYYAQFGLPGHEGVDWACPVGTPVVAAADGEVVTIKKNPNGKHPYGAFVRIGHRHGLEWWVTVYAHFDRIADGLELGSIVTRGQVIGYSGNSGRSTGPHLHFSVRRDGAIIDPEPWLMAEANEGAA